MLIDSDSAFIEGNVISGSAAPPGIEGCCVAGFGVRIADAASSGTELYGNRIGTNAAGTASIGNGTYAIWASSSDNVIGGTTVVDRNLISGNGRGIHFDGLGTQNNVIIGNYIGTDASGTGVLGNQLSGVSFSVVGTGNRVGGSGTGEANVIAGGNEGITIDGSSGVTVEGNLIGVGADGLTPLGLAIGVNITGFPDFPAIGHAIGGLGEGEGNVIANSAGEGIRIQGNATGITVLANRISANGSLGIDLGGNGVTPNDPSDLDEGPNHLLNTPVITDVGPSLIAGTFDAQDGGNYHVELFSNTTCDASGSGEGETLVDRVAVGDAGTFAFDAPAVNGTFLTATLTQDDGSTSEFSPCFPVTTGLPAAGDWVGEKSQEGGGVIPGDDDFVAAGSEAPTGPAQFTYGALDPDPNGGASSPSAEWTFYTTAGATATLDVPWRWTGFHGFAGVDVLLESFVVRDLDDEVFTGVLVDAGPQSCDPCIEPSGGFDYDGVAAIPVEAGDIYGFRITTSNGDTNASLYGELILGDVVPQDCAGARTLYDSIADGRYVIEPAGGQRFSVYCDDMNDGGKDYLSLSPEILAIPGTNTGSYAAGGESTGATVTTHFTKVRLDPSTLTVDIGDLRFADTTGGPLVHSAGSDPRDVVAMPYGVAMACSDGDGPNGVANINLRGTPFAVDDTFAPYGTNSSSFGGATFSVGDQVVDIQANGFCGWRSPHSDSPLYVFGAAGEGPAPDQLELQLRYVNAPVEDVPAPVLLRAAPQGTNTETGIVGRLNAAPGSYTIHLYSANECNDGDLGSDPNELGTAPVTIGPDDQTYFTQLVAHGAISDRYMAISAEADGVESDLSTCVVAQADNDVWPRAARLNTGVTATTVSGWIDQEGKGLWYKFDVDPGAQVTINLSNLPDDYDVFLFKDIQQAYDEQTGLSNTTELTKLSAEFAATNIAPQGYAPQAYAPQGYAPQAYAPQAYAPQAYAPQAYAPQGYAPQAYAPQGYAPQAYAPQGYAPQGYAPQAYAPQGYAPQAYAPAIFLPQAYASAQVTSLFALAAHPGTASETIVSNTWTNAGDFYIRVSGKNGAFSIDAPFSLSVTQQSDICQDVDPDANPPMAISGTPSTLILTDPDRMLSTTPGNGTGDKTALTANLGAFASRVNGSNIGIVDVDLDPGVRAMNAQADLNPACPFAKNLVADEIKDIVDAYRAAHPGVLKYVVLVGDDSVIPFFRYPDQALLGPEQDFVPPVDRLSSSEASLRTNYVLGQDEYGATVVLSHGVSTLPIPDLPVGRLVETANDINLALTGFLALTGGVIPTPRSSLVTGYDFIADASDAIAADLRGGIGTGAGTRHDTLITAFDISPLDSRSWTGTQLKTALATRHDMIFLGGHFSADSALAADFTTTFNTADLASVDLANAIVFSIGCHSGYNTVDAHGIPSVTNTLDWAQAMARKQATFIAGTGYQYGDTDFIEYSERIYVEFARELRRGTGNIAVGDALIRSKQSYLRTTNDLRGLHEKALLESVLYGFPMLAVNLPNRLPGGTPPTIVDDPLDDYGTDPGLTLGLESANVTITPNLTPNTKTLTNVGGTPATLTAKWYSGSNGVATHQNEPALPLEVRNVTAPASAAGKVLRGVLWLGGSYTEESVVPLTGAPATESRGVHTRFASPVFYPIRPWSLNYTDALTSASGSTHLLLTPAQHKGSLTSDQATLRRYGPMAFKLFYSSYVAEAALSAAPEISGITAAALGNQVTFEARVTGNVAAGVQEVWILYTTGPDGSGQGSWVPLQLTQDATDTTLWRATTTVPTGSTIKYLVQAANGLGLVTMNENYGAYHTVGVAGVQPQPLTETEIAIAGPAAGVHAGSVTFTATLTTGSGPLSGKAVTISVGGIASSAATDGNGIATIALPLNVTPGTYTASAAFRADDEFDGSDATRQIVVQKAPTSIALATATSTTPGALTVLATLTSGANNLIERTVGFVITAPGGARSLVTARTDITGQARLTVPLANPGAYSVTASFGQTVGGTGLPVVDLTDINYAASTATISFSKAVRIAFTSSRDGNLEIYRMASDGSGQTRITSNSAIDTEATWSPDGTKIAFASRRTGNGDIYVMNADGTGLTRLTTSSGVDGAPAWSPDGTKIAFVSTRDGNAELYVMNANGSSQRRLTNHNGLDNEPEWSPDGSKLSFTSTRTGSGDIYVLNPNATGFPTATRLTTSSAIDGTSAWSPNGATIVFTSRRDGNFEIYAMNANGTGQTRLTNNGAIDSEPAYTPDGTRIVFASTRTGNGDIYLMNPNGTGVTRLTTSNGIDSSPAAG
jgi:Tol biopolymer transport system component